jgi:hypothetical protein
LLFKNIPIPIYCFLRMFLLLLIIIFEYNHISFAWFVFLTFYCRDILWLWPFFNWMSWRKEEKHFNNTCKCLFFESVGEFSFVGNNNYVFCTHLLYPTLNYFEV